MIARPITYFGIPMLLVCDARCEKAWGMSARPRRSDQEFVVDAALGVAPIDPGTAEGADSKPRTKEERLNKWCARECERSRLAAFNDDIVLPTFGED